MCVEISSSLLLMAGLVELLGWLAVVVLVVRGVRALHSYLIPPLPLSLPPALTEAEPPPPPYRSVPELTDKEAEVILRLLSYRGPNPSTRGSNTLAGTLERLMDRCDAYDELDELRATRDAHEERIAELETQLQDANESLTKCKQRYDEKCVHVDALRSALQTAELDRDAYLERLLQLQGAETEGQLSFYAQSVLHTHVFGDPTSPPPPGRGKDMKK